MKKIRLAAAVGVIALVLLGIAMIPLPHHVECRFKIEPDGADSVYVNAPGQLVVISAAPGEQVTAGEPIITLVNPDMQVELTKLQAERCRCVVRLDELRRRWLHDESAGATIPRLEETILTLDEQIRQKREDLAGLQITAPSDGEVLAAHAVVEKNDGLRRLKQWSGSPLETKNIGATLGSGVLVCRVGDPNKLEAVVEVDQSEVEFLQPGQEVKLQWDGMPGVVMKSTIKHVARLQTDPDNMASDNAGSSASDSHNNQHSGYNVAPGIYYRASAPLADAPCRIPVGAYGRARVHVGYRTVANRVWRELSRTFTFM